MMHDNARESNDMNKVLHLLDIFIQSSEHSRSEDGREFYEKNLFVHCNKFFLSCFVMFQAFQSQVAAEQHLDLISGLPTFIQLDRINRQVKIYLSSFFCPKLLMFSEIIQFFFVFPKAHNETISENYFLLLLKCREHILLLGLGNE